MQALGKVGIRACYFGSLRQPLPTGLPAGDWEARPLMRALETRLLGRRAKPGLSCPSWAHMHRQRVHLQSLHAPSSPPGHQALTSAPGRACAGLPVRKTTPPFRAGREASKCYSPRGAYGNRLLSPSTGRHLTELQDSNYFIFSHLHK